MQQEINKTVTARKEFKIKDIDPYNGEESESLRSFLTAIELRMKNQGIEGDEKKVSYVGGYLRKKAWEWFEVSKFSDKRPIRKDRLGRDGDIVMAGALVNLEKARKQGLCFNYGKKGHKAKNYRLKENDDRKPKEATMRAQILRYETGSVSDSSRTLSKRKSKFEIIYEDDYRYETKQLGATAARFQYR
jgi:hypothetical protein